MRFVVGLWLVQALTAALVWLALDGQAIEQVLLCIGLILGLGVLGGLWIGSALSDRIRLAVSRQSEAMVKRTADLQADLARQRAEDAARLEALTQRTAQARSGMLRLGLISGAAAGIGAALLIAQVFALGLVALAFATGGAAGYVARRGFGRRGAVEGPSGSRDLVVREVNPEKPALAAARRRLPLAWFRRSAA